MLNDFPDATLPFYTGLGPTLSVNSSVAGLAPYLAPT